ncbi:IS6 family transposase [Bacillus mycoides]|uniref:IS6 family transposase n=1 Tax=Bacillus mycoides TaxID=1405 RepID=UPI0009922079|nr:IS6 family transposase [Bacillus mycoides]MED1436420.1 IS6 family transposase [Bacillus mycoides]OOR53888.1 IS6 family transposase [Bacillus mycoides]UNP84500.1 IS6 family transposase [Bacillus mycoides]HDR7602024.1 IS6 family transposase [Bacillus mycoides]
MRYFKGKQFKRDIILVAVGYYCRFSLSYRDVSEILKERGISVHPTTIMRWVHEYGNLIYQIWKVKNKSARLSWHLDETYIKVKGEWRYLYRAIDKDGNTLDIQLRKKRDHRHVKRRFAKSAGFQNLRHASRTIKGIETIQAIYKQRRSLESDSVFSVYKELQQLVAIA